MFKRILKVQYTKVPVVKMQIYPYKVLFSLETSRMGEVRNAYKIVIGKFEVTTRKTCVGEKIILEWILEEQVGTVWTRCIWFRLGICSGLL